MTDNQPIVVLVRPQLGENIGKAARAMLNFGLTQMRLVAPRDGWPNPDAGPSAAGADDVLAEAQVLRHHGGGGRRLCACLCHHGPAAGGYQAGRDAGTGARKISRARTVAARCCSVPNDRAWTFADVSLARTILTVPINPEFGSLNLAQAVLVCSYEWSRLQSLSQPTIHADSPPAPQAELDGLIDHFHKLLEPKGYFYPEGRREATERTLRNVLTKPAWNHWEVRTLRGVLTHLGRADRDR